MSQAFNEIWHIWSVDNEHCPFTSKNKALPVKSFSPCKVPPFWGGGLRSIPYPILPQTPRHILLQQKISLLVPPTIHPKSSSSSAILVS